MAYAAVFQLWGQDFAVDSLDREVHTLAMQYHWSETDILSLPRERRRRYLRLIDRERGVHS